VTGDIRGEEQTLERLAADPSDEGAWTDLYRRYWPFVFAVAYRRCRGGRELAEDIAQHVFLRLLRARPFDRIQSPAALRSFLYVMTENAAKSHLARLLSRRESPLPDSFDAPVESSTETHWLIEQITRTLAPVDQRILALVAAGMGLKEVASATGLSYANTAVRLHRLRKLLRVRLQERATGG
jgi:RNA polymerase sigma factor (sigma-70 family)